MPRDREATRARLRLKLQQRQEEARENERKKQALRASQIEETRKKIHELDVMLAEGTGLLRDIATVSSQIRAQSFDQGASQAERESGALALEKLDNQRVRVEANMDEWNESITLLQDFMKQLS